MAQPVDLNASGPFGELGNTGDMNLDFAALDNADVLEHFDFDNFLHNNDDSGPFFETNFLGGDGDNDGGL